MLLWYCWYLMAECKSKCPSSEWSTATIDSYVILFVLQYYMFQLDFHGRWTGKIVNVIAQTTQNTNKRPCGSPTRSTNWSNYIYVGDIKWPESKFITIFTWKENIWSLNMWRYCFATGTVDICEWCQWRHSDVSTVMDLLLWVTDIRCNWLIINLWH